MEDMNAYKMSVTLAGALLVGCAFGIASAKLPALTDEQKAKAVEAKAKAGEAAKKEAELLTKSQDRAADFYKKSKVVKTGGGAAPAAAVKK
jgi:hypothetical protein